MAIFCDGRQLCVLARRSQIGYVLEFIEVVARMLDICFRTYVETAVGYPRVAAKAPARLEQPLAPSEQLPLPRTGS